MKILKVFIKKILHFKTESFLNFIGLVIGVVLFFIATEYILFEYSYDKHFNNYENIYRVYREATTDGHTSIRVNTGVSFLTYANNYFPEIKNATRLIHQPEFVKVNDQSFKEDKLFYADSTFFKLFDFEFLIGSNKYSLKATNSVVLTEETALKYYGNLNNILLKNIDINGLDYKISGVVKNYPRNTHFHFDILASSNSLKNIYPDYYYNDNWDSRCWTYLSFYEHSNIKDFYSKLNEFVEQFYNYKDYGYSSMSFKLQKLQNIHLNSHYGCEIEKNADKSELIEIVTITLLILIISTLNFANYLSVFNTTRNKEFYIHRILGSTPTKIKLINYVCIFTYTFIIVLISIIITNLVKYDLFRITSINIMDDTNFLSVPEQMLIGFFIVLLTFTIIVIINSLINLKSKKLLWLYSGVNNYILLLQFIIFYTLLVYSIFILKQHQYLVNKDLNFNPKNVIFCEAKNENVIKNIDIFFAELHKLSTVQNYCACSNLSGVTDENWTYFSIINDTSINDGQAGIIYFYGNYINTLQIPIINQKVFDNLVPKRFIVNSKFVNMFKIRTPISKTIEVYSKQNNKKMQYGKGNIDMVIDDYLYKPLYNDINPIILMNFKERVNYILIKLSSIENTSNINKIKDIWENIYPNIPFEMRNLQKEIKRTYKNEFRILQLFSYITLVSFILIILSILEIVLLQISIKNKDIAIHKIYGANSKYILIFLAKDYVIKTIYAIIVAIPISYYLIDKWLQNFSYTISIIYNWLIFIISGIFLIFLVIGVIIIRSWKISKTSPIEALRF